MATNSLTQIVQQVFANVQVVASFNQLNHIEFILVKNSRQEYFLIWLPVTLDTCMWFTVKMNPDKFIVEFQQQNLQNRITYLLQHFIGTDFHDIEQTNSIYLQNTINHGLHNQVVR